MTFGSDFTPATTDAMTTTRKPGAKLDCVAPRRAIPVVRGTGAVPSLPVWSPEDLI